MEAMVKKRRGAAEVEVRREAEEEEALEKEAEVGSRLLWRFSRFESMSKNDSSIFQAFLEDWI